MESMKIGRKTLSGFCARVFGSLGVSDEDARLAAEVLVAADARDIPSHGTARLWRYTAGLRNGLMKAAENEVAVKETPVSLLVDARGALGAPASVRTMRRVIEKADATGMAFACVRDSNHYGIAGYYAMMALEHDMIGLSMTNTAALGVPTFARQVMFGTNPLAFAAPAGREKPFVLDMSTTVVTRGKIEVYDRAGKPLPPGWAVDKDGLSASDAKSLLRDMLSREGGGIVPLGGDSEEFGGHKGYGLAVMVDILTGVMASSAFGEEVRDTEVSSARVSHCFAAMRIDLFREAAEFRRDMDAMLLALRTAPKAAGADRVYYAGLKESEAEERTEREGISLSEGAVAALRRTGQDCGVDFP